MKYNIFFPFAQHVVEIQIDKRREKAYGKWVITQAERDLKHCHPRWPEERQHIDDTIEAINERKRKRYFSNGWNCFDWFVYLLVWVVMATRLLNLLLENDLLKYYHIRVFSITLIFIWLRMLRRLKPFPFFGPFIIMLGHVVVETMKFLVLFMLIYIPYCCAFWMVFGGPKLQHSPSFLHKINDMVYDIFQMSLVGEIKWKEFVDIDETFAQVRIFVFQVNKIITHNQRYWQIGPAIENSLKWNLSKANIVGGKKYCPNLNSSLQSNNQSK